MIGTFKNVIKRTVNLLAPKRAIRHAIWDCWETSDSVYDRFYLPCSYIVESTGLPSRLVDRLYDGIPENFLSDTGSVREIDMAIEQETREVEESRLQDELDLAEEMERLDQERNIMEDEFQRLEDERWERILARR